MNISEHIPFYIQEMERRNFSKNTIENYSGCVKLFWKNQEKTTQKTLMNPI